MTVKVLAFGIVKEIFSATVIEAELNDLSKVEDLKMLLEEKYPRLQHLRSYMIAVNSEYAPMENIIAVNDEIAIIPPVSGG